MIFGHIKNLKQEKALLPKALQNGLEYLATTDLAKLAPGKYEIAGSDIFVSIAEYTTDRKDNKKPETHVKYIDIQYIVSGTESIGYGDLADGLTVTEDKLAEKDVVFYAAVPGESELQLSPGMYAIFFPWDVHRPGCAAGAPAPVKKAIVKVKMDLLP
jgi:biofilm protein TabA